MRWVTRKGSVKDDEQHQVPRLMLRPWEVDTPRGRRVWVYDKKFRTVKDKAVRAIMFGRNFYDHRGITVDPFLSRIESDVAPILAFLRQHGCFPILPLLQQRILALFVATQMFRTERTRAALQQIAAGTLKRRDGFPSATPQEFAETYPGLSPTDVHFDFITDWSYSHAKLYFTKLWVVLRTPASCSLVIGDNPAFSRTQTPTDDGNAKLQEATIYLPISPNLMLCFLAPHLMSAVERRAMCPSRVNQIWLGKASIDEKEARLLNRMQSQQTTRFLVANNPDFVWLDMERASRETC